jgi:acyl-coenzyme A thioesterase PaaI-like protein
VSEFGEGTALTALGAGRYRLDASPRWTVTDSLNGGYLFSVALAALRGEAPHPHALAISGRFLRPTAPGRLEVVTDVFHRGRTFSGAVATVLDGEGRETVRVLTTFGRLTAAHPGPDGFVRGSPPTLPPVERCRTPDPDDPATPELLRAQVRRVVEMRYDPDSRVVTGRPAGEPRLAVWARFADGRPPDLWSLPVFVDVLPPALFEHRPGGWVPTIDLAVHLRAEPAPGWLRCVTETRFAFGGLLEEDAEVWDSAGRLVAQSRQLARIPGGGER